jgi:putative acetyltransferase
MCEATWPRLRPATNADCEPVASLVYAVLAEHHLRPDPDGTDADLRDIEQSYLARGGLFCVLEEKDGSIIGSYGLYPVVAEGQQTAGQRPEATTVSGLPPPAWEATCELRKMYLRRHYRGRGLGRLLLEDALANARRLGFRRITLETASVLNEAIRLYEAYGFTPCRPDHLSPRCNQAYLLELK